ncbi:MAG TPA: hypothetical protein DCZ04_06770 [Syntrophorhabdus aromaticivorans]|nr:hypothetical protein [Syntrophorhabdus aromaticivorans]
MMEQGEIESRISENFDSYELFFLTERTKKLESKDRDLCGVELKEEEGIALRGIKDNKAVFSYTYERGEKAVLALLSSVKVVAPFVEPDNDAGFPGLFSRYPVVELYDGEGLKATPEIKASLLMEMEGLILDYDKRIVATRNCELQEEEIEVEIVNSKGLRAKGRKTLYALSALCVAKDTDEVSWFDWAWAHSLKELDGRALGLDIARKAVSFLSSEQIGTGIYNGILTPQASCEILGILSGSFLAESLYKNKTKLRDKVGEQCFSDAISIVDSGLAGMDGFAFDGEGVPSCENTLVEKGIFRSFLYDTYYGTKFGKPSTGNGVRTGLKELPTCGRRGLFVKEGRTDLYGRMADGIIIEELMGTHTANPITGDFSLGAVGHLVRGGVRTPFKGVIFSGNIFELLRSVREVGNDIRFYGTCGSPSLYAEGMKISGK